MRLSIGITEKNSQKSVSILSTILSDEKILYMKTKKFHWNVSGESFMELHNLFNNQYKFIEESIDEITERISKLGGKKIDTLQEFWDCTRIKESSNTYLTQKEILKELLVDYEFLISHLRKDIDVCVETNKDAVTADFITGVVEQHETTAWIYRKYLN